ncbi:hypothetical protein PAXRUDRAFT_826109 [Paxillus rubicundulus Ve08.2h10]|uniref:RING-CH-type domain-containing protein n=1 Tax=Paxillus rubicundulus Ve08.2h10 TaxID=930991 RepID=A0A0D0DZW7_9AGAM|nr:hypothetical protein PAXRUDRAFT_826109 [Paxillus rubicundulus Ve08.2h10]
MEPQQRVPTIDDLKVKLCYICREEERFDAPEYPLRAWSHPCTCTLIAHESCLLRWIQSSQATRSRASNALKCPQCGTAYQLTSYNPWLLRWLDVGNKGLSMVGRVVSLGSLTVVVVSLGTGMYILSTAYGAYALREFLGDEMFELLLTDDPSNWPWHSFINLPLIPLALIISRLPLRSSVSPLVPLLLAWPTSRPVAGKSFDRIVLSPGPSTAAASSGIINQIQARGQGSNDLFSLLPRWPPPPLILGLFIFPIVREAYKRLLSQVSKWVLDSTPGAAVSDGEDGHAQAQGQGRREDMQRALMGAIGDDEPFLRIRVNAQIDEEAGPAAGDAGGGGAGGLANQAQRQGNNDNADALGDAGAAAENTIRVSGTSLGRLIGGALIIPRISSLMGSLLFHLSKRSALLRKFLAIRAPLRGGAVRHGGPGLGPGLGLGIGIGGLLPQAIFGGKTWAEMGLLKKLGVAGIMGLSVAWRGTYAWAECDPVWWRNSLGLGLFTIAKDCIHLLHLYLTKRELESRRVKNRSFEGVDIRELDLIDPPARL